jgi:nucleoid-associated protein YgaU
MRLSRRITLLVVPLFFGGCGYVHFGRLPREAGGDPALRRSYTDLALEQKILKQELALSRKETDTLRAALDRAGGGAAASAPDLTPQLARTTKKLEQLQASYSALKNEQTAADAVTTSIHTRITTLEEENTRLRHDLDAARMQNASLAEQLKTSVAETQSAQAQVAHLNTDLVAQKEARERAERVTTALRAQLEAVMARSGRAGDTTSSINDRASALGEATNHNSTPVALDALQKAKAPPSGAVPIAELRTSLTRARAVADAGKTRTDGTGAPGDTDAATAPVVDPSAAGPAATAAKAAAPRTYDVQPGDTLEQIAARVYGATDQWVKIYSANSALLTAHQGLKPGMKLQIP